MTSILTEDEINGIADKHEAALGGVWPHEFAEAIIDATIKRLVAGVSVEPVCTTTASISDIIPVGTKLYTGEAFTTAIAAARVQMNEECAKVCDYYAADKWSLYKGRKPYNGTEQGRADPDTQGYSDGASACADAIRDLLGKEQS